MSGLSVLMFSQRARPLRPVGRVWGRRLPWMAAVVLWSAAPSIRADESTGWVEDIWAAHEEIHQARSETNRLAAEAHARNALQRTPENPLPVRHLVNLYQEGGETAMAAMATTYARRLNPSSVQLEEVWDVLRAQMERRIAETRDAEAAPDETYERAVRDAAARAREGDHVAAEMRLRRLLMDRPGDMEVLSHLGSVYVLSGDRTMSAMLYGLAREIEPENADVANNLAMSLEHLGRLAEARETLEAAVRMHPGIDFLVLNLVRMHRQLGDDEKALAALRRWTEHDGANPQAWLMYADRLIEMDRAEQARAVLERLEDEEARPPFYYICQARIAARLDDGPEVVRWLNAVRDRVPPDSFAYALRAPDFRDIPEVEAAFGEKGGDPP